MDGYGSMPPAASADKYLQAGTRNVDVWMAQRPGLFPQLFTLATMAVFAPPVVLGFLLGSEPSVVYWIGARAWCVLVVPCLLLLGHGLHAAARAPSLPGLAFSLILPSIVVLVLGLDQTLQVQAAKSHVLAAGSGPSSPSNFGAKMPTSFEGLDEAHAIAELHLDACVALLAASGGEVREQLSLHDCLPYLQAEAPSEQRTALEESLRADQLRWSREWQYLASLEMREGCAGWTREGRPRLWATADGLPRGGGDPCVSSAWLALENAQRVAYRLLVLGGVLFLGGFWELSGLQRRGRDAGLALHLHVSSEKEMLRESL